MVSTRTTEPDVSRRAGRDAGPVAARRPRQLRRAARCGTASTSTSRRGEFVAVLGPNGSGKTTLVRVLLGLLPLSAGEVRVAGQAPRRGSPTIGYVPQQKALDPDLPLRGPRPRRPRARRAPARARARAGAGPGAGAWTPRSRRSAARRTRTRRSGGSPAASSNGCGWPRPSSAIPTCCSATSRCSRSTSPTSAPSPQLIDERRRTAGHGGAVRDPRDQPGAAARGPGALPRRRAVPDRAALGGDDLRGALRAVPHRRRRAPGARQARGGRSRRATATTHHVLTARQSDGAATAAVHVRGHRASCSRCRSCRTR